MPVQSIQTVDDPLLLDGNNSFVGGQVSATTPDRIPADAYVEAKNMDLDEFGSVITRRGTELSLGYLIWEEVAVNWEDQATNWEGIVPPVTGVTYFDTGEIEYLVIADGDDHLKAVTKDGIFTILTGASYVTGAEIRFAQVGNKLFYTDESSDLRYIEGSTDPVTAETIAAGKITSLTIEDGGSFYDEPPTVTIAAPDTGVTATATATLGYRGDVVDFVMTNVGSGYNKANPPEITVADPTHVSGTTASAHANISQTPSEPKFIVSHTNRLFATSADAGVTSDTLYVSAILDGESWDLAGDNLRIGNDRDQITALMPGQNFDLFVFKERSIYKVIADPTKYVSQWEVKLVNNRTGCVAERSVQQVGADIYFLAREGIRSIQSIQAGTETDISLPISRNINDLIGRINQNAVRTCCAVYWRNRYFLAVPLDDATTPDTVLVYHLLANAWCGYWTGWQPRAFAISGFDGVLKLQIADQAGKMFTWNDSTPESETTAATYKDGIATYESFIKTKAYNYAETWGDKIGYSTQFNLSNIHSTDVTGNFYYFKDLSSSAQDLATSVALTADTGLIRKGYNLLPKGRFNQIQFKAQADSGRLALQSIQTSAFGQPIMPEKWPLKGDRYNGIL